MIRSARFFQGAILKVEAKSDIQAQSVRQFCAAYAIGRTTFYEEVKAGRLRTRKVGKKTLVLNEDALRWRDALPEA